MDLWVLSILNLLVAIAFVIVTVIQGYWVRKIAKLSRMQVDRSREDFMCYKESQQRLSCQTMVALMRTYVALEKVKKEQERW